MLSPRACALWFLGTTVLAGGCDLSTKGWAERALLDAPGQTVSVVQPWLEFSLAYNRGTAFSVVSNLGDSRWLFAALALLVFGGLLVMAMRQQTQRPWPLWALGLTAGGAIGNGYDRAFRITPAGDTGVVDFIRLNLTSSYSWPTFNLADVWLLVGVAALLVWSWRARPDTPLDPEPA